MVTIKTQQSLRRTKSLPNLNSHKSRLIADAEAAKSSKKDRSCLETCCKTFKTFLEILKQVTDERSIQ